MKTALWYLGWGGSSSPYAVSSWHPFHFLSMLPGSGFTTGESGGESLIIELWQLISQDYSMVHASSCDGGQVDDTPTRAIAVHGQSDGCRGFALEIGAGYGLASMLYPSPFQPYAMSPSKRHLQKCPEEQHLPVSRLWMSPPCSTSGYRWTHYPHCPTQARVSWLGAGWC